MRRRDFLAMAVTTAGLLAVRPVLAKSGGQKQRAAVVIGVNKAGQLPVLNAAVSGARTVANWLEAEGFEVKLLVDDGKPVRVSEIFDVIEEFVGRGTLDQLVVYFSVAIPNTGCFPRRPTTPTRPSACARASISPESRRSRTWSSSLMLAGPRPIVSAPRVSAAALSSRIEVSPAACARTWISFLPPCLATPLSRSRSGKASRPTRVFIRRASSVHSSIRTKRWCAP